MKYYKSVFDKSLGGNGEIYYSETQDGWSSRQIIVDGHDWIPSNVKHPQWGMALADKQIDYDSEPSATAVSKQEFDEVWNTYLAIRQTIWKKVKQSYSVGMSVQGFIEIFYPQGVIINLGDEALGVADYAASKASTKPEFMYPKHKVTAVVQGYDEVNQWVVLTSPQVHDQRVDSSS